MNTYLVQVGIKRVYGDSNMVILGHSLLIVTSYPQKKSGTSIKLMKQISYNRNNTGTYVCTGYILNNLLIT